jgi:hypothetical protein
MLYEGTNLGGKELVELTRSQKEEDFPRPDNLRASILLMIVGALTVGSIYFYATVVSGGYYKAEGFDPSRNLNVIEFGLLAPNILLTTWNWLYTALGLAIFGCSLAQLILAVRHATESPKYRILSLVLIGLGIIFLAWLFWYVVWLEPYWGPYSRSVDPGGISITFLHNPNWIVLMTAWKAVSFLLGLAFVGLNIVQFRSKKEPHK